MEIGFVYSSKDPQQLKTRDFVKRYIKEHGMLAHIIESDQPVNSLTVIVNGYTLRDRRKKQRTKKSTMFPDIKAITRILDKHAWCV